MPQGYFVYTCAMHPGKLLFFSYLVWPTELQSGIYFDTHTLLHSAYAFEKKRSVRSLTIGAFAEVHWSALKIINIIFTRCTTSYSRCGEH